MSAWCRWNRIWTLLRPTQSWTVNVAESLLGGHRAGVSFLKNKDEDRRVLDRKSDPEPIELKAIQKHDAKFRKMGIVFQAIPHRSVTKYCVEYEDVMKILGPKIRRKVDLENRKTRGPLKYWVTRKLKMDGLSDKEIQSKLNSIHIPDVMVYWRRFRMCHPVYCVPARGNPVGRLTYETVIGKSRCHVYYGLQLYQNVLG